MLAAGAALAPAWPDWGVNRGFALQRLRRHAEAATAFAAGARIAPAADDVLCYALNGQKRVGAWAGWELRLRDAAAALRARRCPRGWDPLYGLAWPLRGALLRDLAAQIAADKASRARAAAGVAAAAARHWPRAAGRRRALRVGYVSADLRRHVMQFLTRGLFEIHAAGASAPPDPAPRAAPTRADPCRPRARARHRRRRRWHCGWTPL